MSDIRIKLKKDNGKDTEILSRINTVIPRVGELVIYGEETFRVSSVAYGYDDITEVFIVIICNKIDDE